MTILPNGQVQITNNQTGEVRTVDPGQLTSFSPILANQYFAYQSMQKELNKGSGAASAGAANDILQGPASNIDQTGGSSANVPDLSGLSKFASSIKPKQQPKTNILNMPMPNSKSLLTGGNQLSTPQPQQKRFWHSPIV